MNTSNSFDKLNLNQLEKSETNIYIYDKYDIIDFLEPEFIDYLNNIPNNYWLKYQKYIEIELLSLNNEKIIKYILTKIKIKYISNYFNKNFLKMNLELFKILTSDIFYDNKIFKELFDEHDIPNKNDVYSIKLKYCKDLFAKDLNFNKYFYEEYKKNYNISNKHVIEKFFTIIYNKAIVPQLDVMMYYFDKFYIKSNFNNMPLKKKKKVF